jgi:6-phosphofructokinase 1
MDMVDRVRDTTESHDRCSVIEVMGRNAGFLALNAGIAVGATCILVPEIDYDIDSYIIERMRRTMQTGKHHFIIIVAEGVKGVEVGSLAKYIEEKTGVESRATILGHVQRGGSPSVRDRVLASKMGYHAVQLLKEDIGNRVVAIDHEEVVDYDIIEALNMKKTIDPELYKIANAISI